MGAAWHQVNAVAPTYIVTPMTRYGMRDEVLRRPWLDATPRGRLGRPDEIASVGLVI